LNSAQASIFKHPPGFFSRHQQAVKWVVYTLLVLNFGYYLFDDSRAAQSTLLPGASFLEITSAYATTFDELGWFFIILLLELETYWIEDWTKHRFLHGLMQVARVICYTVIIHTLYAFVVWVVDLGNATVLTDVGGLCALVGEGLTFSLHALLLADDFAGQQGHHSLVHKA